jgi:hypothetical protein
MAVRTRSYHAALMADSPSYRAHVTTHGRHISAEKAARVLRAYLQLPDVEAGRTMLEDMVKVREVTVTQHRTTFPFEPTVDSAELFAAMGY